MYLLYVFLANQRSDQDDGKIMTTVQHDAHTANPYVQQICVKKRKHDLVVRGAKSGRHLRRKDILVVFSADH